jgi:hypothetical protein
VVEENNQSGTEKQKEYYDKGTKLRQLKEYSEEANSILSTLARVSDAKGHVYESAEIRRA